MENSKKEYFESLMHFIGYGNPNGNYWFIGLDEHFKISDNNEEIWKQELTRLNIYRHKYESTMGLYSLSFEDFKDFYNKYDNLKNESNNDPTTKGICEIMQVLGYPYATEDLWKENSQVFITNLFPFGRGNSNSGFNKFTQKYIFNGNTFNEWFPFWEERKKLLYRFIDEFMNKEKKTKIICFGVSYISWFEQLFFNFNKDIKLAKNDCVHSNKMDIYLIYHPSRWNRNKKLFTEEKIRKIFVNKRS
jgi:hypothetical protein